MASEFGLNQSQTIQFSPTNKTELMWNNEKEEEDSWEVRAFEEDTTVGCTWPPRSYSCTFCRREFRSAQALGGHMNVHRRDRARLHDAPPPAQELVSSNGLCLLYPLPNPSSILFPSPNSKPNANSVVSFACHSEPSASNTRPAANNYQEKGKDFGANEEELDLELRLGSRTS